MPENRVAFNMKICPSALSKVIVTVLADTPVGEVLSRERTNLIARTYGWQRHSVKYVAICALMHAISKPQD